MRHNRGGTFIVPPMAHLDARERRGVGETIKCVIFSALRVPSNKRGKPLARIEAPRIDPSVRPLEQGRFRWKRRRMIPRNHEYLSTSQAKRSLSYYTSSWPSTRRSKSATARQERKPRRGRARSIPPPMNATGGANRRPRAPITPVNGGHLAAQVIARTKTRNDLGGHSVDRRRASVQTTDDALATRALRPRGRAMAPNRRGWRAKECGEGRRDAALRHHCHDTERHRPRAHDRRLPGTDAPARRARSADATIPMRARARAAPTIRSDAPSRTARTSRTARVTPRQTRPV